MRLGWFHRQSATALIAPLETRHAARLAEIHRGAFARPWEAHDFERCLAERNVLADGVFLGSSGEPAGFALSRRAADEAEILSVAVLPEARGRGHAAALLSRHLEALAQRGVRHVHLEVEEGNEAALALYRRHDFHEVGRRPGYYARPDGTRVAALIMSRTL
jgi:ribosomal-protein-alanine N-acetyltransferase